MRKTRQKPPSKPLPTRAPPIPHPSQQNPPKNSSPHRQNPQTMQPHNNMQNSDGNDGQTCSDVSTSRQEPVGDVEDGVGGQGRGGRGDGGWEGVRGMERDGFRSYSVNNRDVQGRNQVIHIPVQIKPRTKNTHIQRNPTIPSIKKSQSYQEPPQAQQKRQSNPHPAKKPNKQTQSFAPSTISNPTMISAKRKSAILDSSPELGKNSGMFMLPDSLCRGGQFNVGGDCGAGRRRSGRGKERLSKVGSVYRQEQYDQNCIYDSRKQQAQITLKPAQTHPLNHHHNPSKALLQRTLTLLLIYQITASHSLLLSIVSKNYWFLSYLVIAVVLLPTYYAYKCIATRYRREVGRVLGRVDSGDGLGQDGTGGAGVDFGGSVGFGGRVFNSFNYNLEEDNTEDNLSINSLMNSNIKKNIGVISDEKGSYIEQKQQIGDNQAQTQLKASRISKSTIYPDYPQSLTLIPQRPHPHRQKPLLIVPYLHNNQLQSSPSCRHCPTSFTNTRIKHCTRCDVCHIGYDHYCKWLAVCVDGFNYGYFMRFLAVVEGIGVGVLLVGVVDGYRVGVGAGWMFWVAVGLELETLVFMVFCTYVFAYHIWLGRKGISTRQHFSVSPTTKLSRPTALTSTLFKSFTHNIDNQYLNIFTGINFRQSLTSMMAGKKEVEYCTKNRQQLQIQIQQQQNDNQRCNNGGTKIEVKGSIVKKGSKQECQRTSINVDGLKGKKQTNQNFSQLPSRNKTRVNKQKQLSFQGKMGLTDSKYFSTSKQNKQYKQVDEQIQDQKTDEQSQVEQQQYQYNDNDNDNKISRSRFIVQQQQSIQFTGKLMNSDTDIDNVIYRRQRQNKKNREVKQEVRQIQSSQMDAIRPNHIPINSSTPKKQKSQSPQHTQLTTQKFPKNPHTQPSTPNLNPILQKYHNQQPTISPNFSKNNYKDEYRGMGSYVDGIVMDVDAEADTQTLGDEVGSPVKLSHRVQFIIIGKQCQNGQ